MKSTAFVAARRVIVAALALTILAFGMMAQSTHAPVVADQAGKPVIGG